MPLIPAKAQKAAESTADTSKPQTQSIAVAYDMNRRNKRKKMTEGGEVQSTKIIRPRMVESSVIKPRMRDEEPPKPSTPQEVAEPQEMVASAPMEEPTEEHSADDNTIDMDDEHHDSIAAAIMARRRRLMSKEEPEQVDDPGEVDLKADYDSDLADLDEPKDEESDDKQDRVSAIRARMNIQRQFKTK